MWQFLAAAGRAMIARPVGATRMAGLAKAAKGRAIKPGGGFANSVARQAIGETRESFASRALTAGWALQQWNQQMEDWFPKVKHAVTVTVNGGKVTPNTDVVHAALSIAFGALLHRPASLSSVTITLKNDPVNNACTVVFLISNISALFIAELLINGLFRLVGAVGGAIARGVKEAVKELSPLTPGTVKRGNDKAPPLPPGVPAGEEGGGLLDEIKKINDKLARQFAGAGAFHMGREMLNGGKPPVLCNEQDKGGPFDDMVYKLWLTRNPAANPLPPSNDGMDLRTLVAQVLHDPGVRPPRPETDKGPPVVDNEVLGK